MPNRVIICYQAHQKEGNPGNSLHCFGMGVWKLVYEHPPQSASRLLVFVMDPCLNCFHACIQPDLVGGLGGMDRRFFSGDGSDEEFFESQAVPKKGWFHRNRHAKVQEIWRASPVFFLLGCFFKKEFDNQIQLDVWVFLVQKNRYCNRILAKFGSTQQLVVSKWCFFDSSKGPSSPLFLFWRTLQAKDPSNGLFWSMVRCFSQRFVTFLGRIFRRSIYIYI